MQLNSVYVAAAIDHKRPNDLDAFEMIAKKLDPLTCFNPKAAFFNANQPQTDQFVANVNFGAIRNADIVVAYVEEGATSFGVPMELMYATIIGKPVVLVTDMKTGIYSRLFSSAVFEIGELTVEALEKIYDKHSSLGDEFHMISVEKQRWIRNLLGGNNG